MSLQLDAGAVKKVIDDEPEMPGEIPDSLWHMMNGSKEMTAEVIKITVRQIKNNIKKRLEL